MKHVAIVVTSHYGQTVKIAECLRSVLEEFDQYVRLFVVQNESDLNLVRLEHFDAVIVGAPVYVGKFPLLLTDWAKSHREIICNMPSAFFSVSLNAADKRPEARKEDSRLISEFVLLTGIKPFQTASMIGAVHYRKYGLVKRWLLKHVFRIAGCPTDTARNHELTDWSAVKDFAMNFANAVSRTPKISAIRFPE